MTSAGAAKAAYVGGTSYQEKGDSAFSGLDFSAGYFYLEDFEDNALNTPGVTASAGNTATLSGFSGTIIDSVDEDDGTVDGQCVNCNSWYSPSGPGGVTFTFNETVLGALPTHVGVVWTDGANDVQFIAYDANGVSLGVFGPFSVAGPGVNDQDVLEDTFIGVISAIGISAIHIFSGSAGIELDHLQYGIMSFNGDISDVPVPAALPLFLAGLAGLGAANRRKKRA